MSTRLTRIFPLAASVPHAVASDPILLRHNSRGRHAQFDVLKRSKSKEGFSGSSIHIRKFENTTSIQPR